MEGTLYPTQRCLTISRFLEYIPIDAMNSEEVAAIAELSYMYLTSKSKIRKDIKNN